jgi:hypothetical protein
MSDSASTGCSAPQSEPPVVEKFTIDVTRGKSADGSPCWAATTATETSATAGSSATSAAAIRRLATVRTRRQRAWAGDAWVDHTPRPAVSVPDNEVQFSIEVTLLADPDEQGRQWSASTEGRDPGAWGYGRTMGETLRQLSRDVADESFAGCTRDQDACPSITESQVDLLLEEGRGLVFRADTDARVAACFDQEGRMIGRPKTFIDGDAVGPRQDVEWPAGIVVAFDRPGIVYDDLRRQFEASQDFEEGESDE